jgi:hypothetical protein
VPDQWKNIPFALCTAHQGILGVLNDMKRFVLHLDTRASGLFSQVAQSNLDHFTEIANVSRAFYSNLEALDLRT